ncbi:hypothetical protein D3C87_1779490 [compost metagenome]
MAAFRDETGSGEDAVAKIGLGDGAKAGNGTAFCHAAGFGFCHMRRMDKAPAIIDRRILQKPLHRPRT